MRSGTSPRPTSRWRRTGGRLCIFFFRPQTLGPFRPLRLSRPSSCALRPVGAAPVLGRECIDNAGESTDGAWVPGGSQVPRLGRCGIRRFQGSEGTGLARWRPRGSATATTWRSGMVAEATVPQVAALRLPSPTGMEDETSDLEERLASFACPHSFAILRTWNLELETCPPPPMIAGLQAGGRR